MTQNLVDVFYTRNIHVFNCVLVIWADFAEIQPISGVVFAYRAGIAFCDLKYDYFVVLVFLAWIYDFLTQMKPDICLFYLLSTKLYFVPSLSLQLNFFSVSFDIWQYAESPTCNVSSTYLTNKPTRFSPENLWNKVASDIKDFIPKYFSGMIY